MFVALFLASFRSSYINNFIDVQIRFKQKQLIFSINSF